MTRPEGTESQAEAQQLLPGIPDDITLDHITPKFPFIALRVLSSVSSAWHHAIRTREVHHSRLSSHSTETFLLIRSFVSDTVGVLSLYSLTDNLSHELPPLPPLSRGTPDCCECVVSEGKVYVLGGEFPSDIERSSAIPNDNEGLFVLDLAGQWQWNQCEGMHKPRKEFACAAINGKVYALGGRFFCEPVCDSQVYDPKENNWVYIEPMPSERFNHLTVTLGEEVCVYGGSAFDPQYLKLIKEKWIGYQDQDEYIEDMDSLEVYNPVTSNWRVVEDFQGDTYGTIFVAQGKFYSASDVGISVYCLERNSWTDLYSHSFDGAEQWDSIWPIAVVAVEHELLAIIHWFNGRNRPGTLGTCLARSRGFGSENTMIVWEKAKCSLSFPDPLGFFPTFWMHPVRL